MFVIPINEGSPVPLPLAEVGRASAFRALIVGVDADSQGRSDRPLARGDISMRAARVARALCLVGAGAAGACSLLPPAWWCLEVQFNTDNSFPPGKLSRIHGGGRLSLDSLFVIREKNPIHKKCRRV